MNMGTAVEYPGDLLIGGLFPVHQIGGNGGCSTEMAMDGFFGLEAFLYSLDKMNKDLKATVGFTLGAVVFDTCSSERHALVKVRPLLYFITVHLLYSLLTTTLYYRYCTKILQ